MNREEALGKLSQWSNVSTAKITDISELSASRKSLDEMAKIVGIPKRYASKCPLVVLTPQLEYWLSKFGKSVYAYYKDRKILKLTTCTDRFVDPTQLFLAIESGLQEISTVDYVNFNGHITCAIVTPKGKEVRVGDIVNYGVQFTIYPNGYMHPQVNSYLYRLACSNGATSTINVFHCQRKQMGDVIEWAEKIAQEAWQRAEDEANLLKSMDETRLTGDIEKLVKHLTSRIGIPLKVRKTFLERVKNENPETMYDLWNIVTSIGAGLGQTELSGLMKVVGGRLMEHYTVCPACQRPY